MNLDEESSKRIARAMHNLGYEMMPNEVSGEIDRVLNRMKKHLIDRGHVQFAGMSNDVFFKWLQEKGMFR